MAEQKELEKLRAQDQREIKALRKELQRKEKAMAEMAALLARCQLRRRVASIT
jgi:Skp family chaperone for outer membrane proteins